VCVKPGEPVTVTLSQSCLPGLVRGYQAFLEFTPGRLNFSSGAYVTPMPYGLPILDPINAVGANLDLAAGINDPAGQTPTSSSAALATLNFTAGATEGLTQVVFRTHAPPTRFSDPVGAEVVPMLIDSQTICVDGTPPSITCPPLNVQCFAELPPPAADYAEFAAQGGVAVDNGCYGPVPPTITFESYIDNGGGGCPGNSYIMERTYRATDCAGNYSECVQTITVVDNTPPSVSAGTIGYCYPSVAAAEAAAIAATTYSDNCTPAGALVVTTSTIGACSAAVTVTVTDICNNSASVSYGTRIDSTAPSIGGSIAGGALSASCGASVLVSVTVTDNCGILASAVGFSMSTTSGAINAGDLVKTQVNPTTVTINGDATLTGVVTCSATVSISITGADECGNPAPAFSVSGVWSDTSAPVVNAGADPPPYPADAGGCTALVSWAAATATDNCPTTFTTAYDIDEGDNGSNEVTDQVGTTHVFPVGTHRVTARVSDGCGNEGSDYFLVTVLPVNELVVSVEFGWAFTGTRCITFDLWNCPGATPAATVSQVLVFTGGMAASQVVLVPCASGPYECITARDRLHTLRQTDEGFDVVDTQYVADFTGDDKLIGGNLNDDYWIDILDFGVFSYQWGVHYDSNGDAIYDANTTCSTPYPHAEINGTAAGLYPTTVYTDDFTFIQQNYLMHHEANCCGQAGLQGNDGRMIYVAEGGSGPITSIPVAELIARGMGELSAGDLNRDGVLDMLDIIAFVTGARPSVDEPVPAAPPARVAPESAPIRIWRP
ncbi:MAG: hypothetical protein HZB38_05720, partial [Planctomycetes bacterium]|nr:hypothetical protein [Planctomycetota bacterium]